MTLLLPPWVRGRGTLEQGHLREELAHKPVDRQLAELGTVRRTGGDRATDSQPVQRRADAGEHIRPHGEKTAEAHIDEGFVAPGDPGIHLRIARFYAHG